MGDGACLCSDELKIFRPVQHTAIRPKKPKWRNGNKIIPRNGKQDQKKEIFGEKHGIENFKNHGTERTK
jgi:hypothetical protein